MTPLHITDCTLVSALGRGREAHWQALQNAQSGLKPCDFPSAETLQTWIGTVEGLGQVVMPDDLSLYDCRNNRLALLGLQQDTFFESVERAKNTYGASRIGIFIGTSTSGILTTEQAYSTYLAGQSEALPDDYHYHQTHDLYSATDFVARVLGVEGISHTVSTACSSSAKVFAAAQRAIDSGFCDAAVVAGVDSLCRTTLYGFHSLQVTSEDMCRPADAQRSGISIGEAAGFALLEKQNSENKDCPRFCAYGESSDAYHMSSPPADGSGAEQAMSEALQRAGLAAEDISYINLHGTATPANDSAECKAVSRLFGNATPCSSTKGWTGHTLGAAGIIEVIFSTFAIKHNYLPQSLNTRQLAPDIEANVLLSAQERDTRFVLSNSFGFGGSNCSLIIGG